MIKKKNIVAMISKRTGFAQTDILTIVNEMMQIIKESLVIHNDTVVLRGFGKFVVEKTMPRRGYNFQTGGTCLIPGILKVKFMPSPTMAEEIKNGVIDDEKYNNEKEDEI